MKQEKENVGRLDIICHQPIVVYFTNSVYMYMRHKPSARSEGLSSRSMRLCVCLCVRDYSRTTGYEAAYELYQQLQCYKGKKNNVAILLKPLRSGDMA